MSVRVVCALCARPLIRVGVTNQVRCPVHGSRGVQERALTGVEAAKANAKPRHDSTPASAPSKPVLGHPDYSAGTEDR